MTVRELIYATTQRLEGVGISSARLDAEVLLAFCLDCDRLEFIKRPERKLSNEQLAAFKQLVARRANCEPVAYITGRKAFWSFTLEVNPDVLIPRPDTEVIVEEALGVLRKKALDQPRILDVGTGSGAIALALACEIPGAKITATDISANTLAVALKNALSLGLGN
jgi:release factor glutamine methyltransferase